MHHTKKIDVTSTMCIMIHDGCGRKLLKDFNKQLFILRLDDKQYFYLSHFFLQEYTKIVYT